MSRFALVCSLVLGLSSTSLVGNADAQFAKAPPTVAMADTDAPAGVPSGAAGIEAGKAAMRMPDGARAPRRWLDRDAVRAALVKARATNLAAFHAYQKKGVFPSNTYKNGKLNVWLDRDGHFCAAATIIKMSGQDELVNKVAEQNNFIRLADVKQGPLMDWILVSGFTQDEIAAIQEPFMRVDREPMPEPVVDPILAAKPPAVDAKLRKAEDARLRAKYKAVDKMLAKNAKKSLDKAVDRLMKNEQLAFRLLDAQG